MKKLYPGLKLFLLCIVVIHLVSCKKDKDGKDVTPANEYVEIEGEKYPTVKIGSQIWTTENYRGPGGEPFDSINHSKPEYGRYYSFEEVENIKLPAGWKIPSKDDYKQLAESQGVVFAQERASKQDAIKKLVSKTGWLNINGNNQSGFNVFPAGYLIGGHTADGDIGEFWTSDRNTFSFQESADQVNHNIVIYINMENDRSKFNVRFVKE